MQLAEALGGLVRLLLSPRLLVFQRDDLLEVLVLVVRSNLTAFPALRTDFNSLSTAQDWRGDVEQTPKNRVFLLTNRSVTSHV